MAIFSEIAFLLIEGATRVNDTGTWMIQGKKDEIFLLFRAGGIFSQTVVGIEYPIEGTQRDTAECDNNFGFYQL